METFLTVRLLQAAHLARVGHGRVLPDGEAGEAEVAGVQVNRGLRVAHEIEVMLGKAGRVEVGPHADQARFTALRYFALDGTDHPSHKEQGSMIRRYIIRRNRHIIDERLRAVVARANVALMRQPGRAAAREVGGADFPRAGVTRRWRRR
ncbi:hypothetical protein ACIOGZ_29335 [Kitasatospora sp. NPDC088160]|uniref:hypothetical protein n=1 Tax=Kitasatospora sp. NPDC088160 TaxID=3364072 RepID=UPI0038260E11